MKQILSPFGEKEIETMMVDYDVIKSRRKLEAIVHNAKLFQAIIKEFGGRSVLE